MTTRSPYVLISTNGHRRLRPNRVTLLDALRDHLGLNGTKITGFQFRFSGAATIWSESAPKRKVGGVRIAAIATGAPCPQPYATAFSASK
jgi:aerobic-type carbon monoxide dehydrogenase small subunit (CoxS/CutS family)